MDARQTIPPDFEAEITILTTEEGGRLTPPLNGIRWDFGYPDQDISEGIYMIWPYFIDQDQRPIPEDQRLVGTYNAHMFIVAREMVDYHKQRISVGSTFNCHEGAKVVAKGVVKRLLALKS